MEGRAAARIACQGLTAVAQTWALRAAGVFPRARPAVEHLAQGQPEDEDQHEQGQGLEGLFPPQRQRRAQAAADQDAGHRDCRRACDLFRGNSAQKRESMKTGSPAANITSTCNKLARSFPSTSSWLERFVSSSRTKVRRSFSWATALAASMAEKKTAKANCSGARIWKTMPANCARSLTSRTICVPVSTSQAVQIKSSRAAG